MVDTMDKMALDWDWYAGEEQKPLVSKDRLTQQGPINRSLTPRIGKGILDRHKSNKNTMGSSTFTALRYTASHSPRFYLDMIVISLSTKELLRNLNLNSSLVTYCSKFNILVVLILNCEEDFCISRYCILLVTLPTKQQGCSLSNHPPPLLH